MAVLPGGLRATRDFFRIIMTPQNPAAVRMRLPSGGVIQIDTEDRADLIARGFVSSWFIVTSSSGGRTVKTIAPGTRKQIPLAHLILQPPDGEKVSHRDGDRLNLTRRNLMLMTDRTRARAEDLQAARGRLAAERSALRQAARQARTDARAARAAEVATRQAARTAAKALHVVARDSDTPLPRGVHWTPAGFRGEVSRFGTRFVGRSRTADGAAAFVAGIRAQLASAEAAD